MALCETTGKHIRVMTDSTTALAYMKHHGGVRWEECNQVAQEILDWAEERENWISAAHIPGVENVVADFKSRNFQDNAEWCLNDKIFNRVVSVFGKQEIDLFSFLDFYLSWKILHITSLVI